MKLLSFTVLVLLLMTASAFAGLLATPPPKPVPVFSPWLSMGLATVLGLGGFFTLLRRKK